MGFNPDIKIKNETILKLYQMGDGLLTKDGLYNPANYGNIYLFKNIQ